MKKKVLFVVFGIMVVLGFLLLSQMIVSHPVRGIKSDGTNIDR